MVQSIELGLAEARHHAPDPSPMHIGSSQSIEDCPCQVKGWVEHIALLFGFLAFSHDPINLDFPSPETSKAFMRNYVLLSDCSETFFVFNSVSHVGIQIGLVAKKAEIESCNGLISNTINILPHCQIEISLMDIQVETSIENGLMQVKANFLGNPIGRKLFREEAEHEITGIAKVNKSKFQFVMVIMIEDEIFNLLTTALKVEYVNRSKKVTLGSWAFRIGPVVQQGLTDAFVDMVTG